MLAVTNPGGLVGVVMPHGIIFRGGAEGTIREGVVEADLFEAIIGLAPNLFYGASIPVAICILHKDKPRERRGKVLFVDANQPGYFRAGKAQNLLEAEHVAKIIEAFRAYEEVERFAYVANLKEIPVFAARMRHHLRAPTLLRRYRFSVVERPARTGLATPYLT